MDATPQPRTFLWLTPGDYTKIIIAAGCLNLALALWWAPRWKQMGMAWAVVASEYMVSAAVCIAVTRCKKNPFWGASEPRAVLIGKTESAIAGEAPQ